MLAFLLVCPEASATGTLLNLYTYTACWMHGAGIDEPLLMERDLNSNGAFDPTERFTYHTDGLGSVTELTNTAGATIRSYYYDAFGQITN